MGANNEDMISCNEEVDRLAESEALLPFICEPTVGVTSDTCKFGFQTSSPHRAL